jgi:galactose mutarotase-like enzyme
MSPSNTHAPPWVTIHSPELSAEVNPLGAQLSSLRDAANCELLWQGDAAIWSGRAPLLFPIVGALAGGRYRLGSRSYPLGRHGFARGRMFGLLDSDDHSATFELNADEATLAVYPFLFQLQVRFVIHGASLSVTMQVRNTGAADMPASMGYHPGLCWPMPGGRPRAAHYLEFESDEPAPARRIDAQGLLTPELQVTPIANRRLQLNDALFHDDVLIFDQVRSRSVSYGADAGPRIRIDFPDARYLGVWTKPGAPFICIEPWQGITDPAGYGGDFRDKPGVFVLTPGSSRSLTMRVSLQ